MSLAHDYIVVLYWYYKRVMVPMEQDVLMWVGLFLSNELKNEKKTKLLTIIQSLPKKEYSS
jgi:hypothetical protein